MESTCLARNSLTGHDQSACYADKMEEKVLPLLIAQPNHRSWRLPASEATKVHSQGLDPFSRILHLKLKKSGTWGWPAGTRGSTHPWLLQRLSALPELSPQLWVLGMRINDMAESSVFFQESVFGLKPLNQEREVLFTTLETPCGQSIKNSITYN